MAICITIAAIAASSAAFARMEAGMSAAPAREQDEEGWFCPMHPDVTARAPGRCPKFDMVLLHGNPFDTREYTLDMRTTPGAVRPGMPAHLSFTVRHPGTQHNVESFEVLPRPGIYRAWTQFLRHDKLTTFTFTFRVFSVEEAYRPVFQ